MSKWTGLRGSDEHRLMARVKFGDDHWTWQGTKQLRWAGKLITPWRAMWVSTFGNLPDDQAVIRSCQNTDCVNVAHLKVVARKTMGTGVPRPLQRKASLTPEIMALVRTIPAHGKGCRGLLRRLAKLADVHPVYLAKLRSKPYQYVRKDQQ